MNCHAFLTGVSLTIMLMPFLLQSLWASACTLWVPLPICLVKLFFCQFPASQPSFSSFILISFIFALLLPA